MSLKQKVVKGFAWALLERFSMQFASFFISMILARLLTPDDYGTIALLTIFIALSSVFADSGFGSALIQKKEATEADFNSVFYLSLFTSSLVYGILFVIAPWVANYYETPILADLLRFLGLSIPLNAINSIQNAELSRKMLFHLSFRISLIGLVATSTTGVTLAFLGYGPWALAWSTISGAIVGVVTRWYFIAWRPKLMFSWQSVKGLFAYGWKLTVSAFLDAGYSNLSGLLIGTFYSKADLAFVDKGRSIPSVAMNSINGTLGRVAFPALAQVQDQRDKVRDTMRRMITTCTFFVFPLMTGCAVCSPSLVPLLFGNQWLPAIPYVQLACFTFALWPFHTINLQAINALGRSDIFLTLEIIKKGLGLVAILLTVRLGIWWMVAVGAFVMGPMSVLINSWPNRKLLNYTIRMQLRDVLPALLLCGGMAAVILPFTWLPLPRWGKLLIQVPLGGITYFLFAILFRVRALQEYLQIGGPILQRFVKGSLAPLVNKVVMYVIGK